MQEITFVTWLWTAPRGIRRFLPEHVNVHHAMVKRYAKFPHRYVCITDQREGFNPGIKLFPMPHTGLEHVVPPAQTRDGKEWPSCYRRLWVFSKKAKALGKRLFCTDIDCIVTDDLAPLVSVKGDFVGWCNPKRFGRKVAGGAYMLTPGTHLDVWEDFDPETSPQLAAEAGFLGSDQAWMSYKLWPPDAQWTPQHGICKLNWLGKPSKGPGAGTRLVFTSGVAPPWNAMIQRRYPWVKEYWRL